jgi:hypothetical protein
MRNGAVLSNRRLISSITSAAHKSSLHYIANSSSISHRVTQDMYTLLGTAHKGPTWLAPTDP